MSKVIKLKKGLDISLVGEALQRRCSSLCRESMLWYRMISEG